MYFFTDVAKIVGQARGFGPAADQPEYRFQLTSQFFVQTGALAYAALPGTVLVQPIDNSQLNSTDTLVNIALRVNMDEDNPYTPTAYIIYRGIRRDSLLVPGPVGDDGKRYLALAPEGTTDLVTQLWQNKRASLTSTTSLAPDKKDTEQLPSIFSLGWDLKTDDGTMTLAEAFSQPRTYELATVREGASIGVFDAVNGAGIEILLVERFEVPTLSTVRKNTNVLEVFPQDTATLPSESYGVRSQREVLLSYLDPCAWYALRAYAGIRYKQAAVEKRAVGQQEVYDQLLTYFSSKNNIYIDLRNEVSHSLGFYQEYPSGTTPADAVYYPFSLGSDAQLPTTNAIPVNYRWPLYILAPQGAQATQYPTSNTAIADTFSSLQFGLQKTYNPDPLAYLEFAFTGRDFTQLPVSSKRFVSEDPAQGITPVAVNPWSQPVRVQTPTLGPAGSAVNYCWVVKLMVVRQDLPTPLPSGSLPRRSYLDNLFGPLLPLPTTTHGMGKNLPIIPLGKRWFYLSSASGVRLGGVVSIVLEYSSKEVFFTANLVDLYGDDEFVALTPSKYANTTWQFNPVQLLGAAVPVADAERTTTEELLQRWAHTTLGDQLYKFAMPAPVNYNAPAAVLGLPTTAANLQHPGYLSLYMKRSEYDDIATAAGIVFDVRALGETSLCFTNFTYRKTTARPVRTVFETQLQMGGLSLQGHYQTTSGANQYNGQQGYNSMPYVIPAVSLDGFLFNTAQAGLDAPVPTLVGVTSPYPVAQFIADQRACEAIYKDKLGSDTRLDQMVTRLRVHYYGYHYIADAIKTGKGYIFNLDIQNADYWEDPVVAGHRLEGVCNPAGRDVPLLGTGLDPTDVANCRVRQLYSFSGELSEELYTRLSGGPEQTGGLKLFLDPDGVNVDLSHSLYTLDSLFISPVPGRAATRAPSPGIVNFGIADASDLPSFIGDITGVLAVSYALWEKNPDLRNTTTLTDVVELEYLITAPLNDLYSDAEGFGLYDLWQTVFHGRQNVTFSELLTRYYLPPPNVVANTYKQRWKSFCVLQKFIVPSPIEAGKYNWVPDITDKTGPFMRALRNRVNQGYRFGYFAEAGLINQGLLASYVIAGGPEFMKGTLDSRVPALQEEHLDLVLGNFLTQVKALLIAEHSCQLTS